jgi:hypothetical protein
MLRMLQVALRQGASIPRALEVVGSVAGDDCGRRMREAGKALGRGASWHDAWCVALADEGESGKGKKRDRKRGDRPEAVLTLICAVLESSWAHGDAPGVRIETAIEQSDRDERAAIERGAAQLSVKLLMPTGLCFLPAFVFIGVVPAVASFMM